MRTRPASSPTWAWSSSRSWSVAARCRSSTRRSRGRFSGSATTTTRPRRSPTTSTRPPRSWMPPESSPSICRFSPVPWADNTIHYMGHVRMMGAVQPFISGAISKTVNMPESASVADVEELHLQAWKLGLKAVAIYRDNCKVAQPLSSGKGDDDGAETAGSTDEDAIAKAVNEAIAQVQAEPTPQEASPGSGLEDLLVPGGGLPRLCHRRRVRRRPTRRVVPEGRQAGLDACRHHGRVRDLGEPRAAVRRAPAVPMSRPTPTCGSSRPASPTTPICVSLRAWSTTSSGASRSSTCPTRSAWRWACCPPQSVPSPRFPVSRKR